MEEVFVTDNFERTQELGEKFAKKLKPGDIVCLYGDLGTGKTTFTQGLARGLGIKNRIISPSFIIVRKYKISSKYFVSGVKYFYHIDLYRIENKGDIGGLGLEEIFDDKNSIVVIEWAEKLGSELPKKRTDIYFENLEDDKRKIIWR